MRQVLPVLLVIFSSLGIALAGAAGMLLLTLGPCGMSSGTVTTWLVFEVDVKRLPTGTDVSPSRIIPVLNSRLNTSILSRTAQIAELPGGMIEVGLIGMKEKDVDERTQQRISAVGAIEFRVLAHAGTHANLMLQAQSTTRDIVSDPSGRVVGRWVEVAPESTLGTMGGDIVQRTVSRDNAQIDQVLTVEMADALTNDAIQSAVATTDQQSQPSVRLHLTENGAARMNNLTASSSRGQLTYLGIVLDGKLLSALPAYTEIRAADITGRFSQTDAEQLAAIINAGPLPAPLKFVGRKNTPK